MAFDIAWEKALFANIRVSLWGQTPQLDDSTEFPLVWLNALKQRSQTPKFVHDNAIVRVSQVLGWPVEQIRAEGVRNEMKRFQELCKSGQVWKYRLRASDYRSLDEYILAAWKFLNGWEDNSTFVILKTTMGLLGTERWWAQ